ncbi:SMP-30/gluconolactonase/LRE family protein [Polyangium sorediatum]|uniref:SMP-30/Gluconolactonase/LRE-like region domain-containing protein n=1 Tax=Polyangium sorediatum TaxID=889274 RepID=A0ABT6P8S4_9BACT|nr:SMP-30/gluconolactonase/LRE family protein [Polyangium sorediatum]MDI1437002.1 hypothetical protein [Polyangium sorediatum]
MSYFLERQMIRETLLVISLIGAAGCGPSVAVDSSAHVTPPIEHIPDPAEEDTCAPGEAVTIATIPDPAGLALGEGNLFFTDGGDLYGCDGVVVAVSLAGGEPVVLASELCAPNRIVYADRALYWASHSGYGRVTRFSLEDGTMEDLLVGLASPNAIAVDGKYVYVGELVTYEKLQSPGQVLRLDLTTRETVVLGESPGGVADITFDEKYVYWTGSVGFLNGKENHDSGVWRVPKEGGEAVQLLGGLAWPFGLSRVGTRVVFAHSHDGEIVSMDAHGGEPQVLADGLAYPNDVAVDAKGEVFFGSGDAKGEGPQGLFAVPLDGSAPPRLVEGALGSPDQVALGATCVYWTEKYVDDDFNGVVRKTRR